MENILLPGRDHIIVPTGAVPRHQTKERQKMALDPKGYMCQLAVL